LKKIQFVLEWVVLHEELVGMKIHFVQVFGMFVFLNDVVIGKLRQMLILY
jgi:hypothetical protein